ncbi:helix-turn-helix domain-containing protein [Sphingopyxis sp. L1A2A]|uniref:helix-turn-helix domain-containing protein n=1 Tax=Sphingopyxis sp. L1A2A TaxID=2502247 RepID=UPI0010F81D26|nr:helix-turn-helix domain-containing protein [Sphingopyxis sp. L1A2A]
MAIPAFIDKAAPVGAKSRSARRKLRLQLQGTGASGVEVEVLVHNISATGLLLEGEATLALGDAIEIGLPDAGATRARVIWASGSLYGCQFDTPISPATLSAAQLRAVVGADSGENGDLRAAINESFGVRLHRLRTAKRLTQVQIAAQLGVSEQSISAWEQDKARPKMGRTKVLAALLGVELPELLGIDEPESLSDVVARAKAQLAEAADVGIDNVKIIIEI